MKLQLVESLEMFANHPSAYLAQNRDTCIFQDESSEGLIAYRDAGRGFSVMVGGVIAPDDRRAILLKKFVEHCNEKGRKVIAVQLLEEDAQLCGQLGFTVNQLGSSYCVKLPDFSFKGTRFIRLRNKISRSKRAGVVIKEVGKDIPASDFLTNQVSEIDSEWLEEKGKKELTFLIGELGDLSSLDQNLQRVFIAELDGQVVGYILYSKCFGQLSGWMHDLSRRRRVIPPGVMEHINAHALEQIKSEGSTYLHFGFTPLTGLEHSLELENYFSSRAAWVLKKLAKHGSFVYPAESQLQYKKKWFPDLILPEYVAFQGGFSLSALWNLLRLTRAL